MRPKGYNCAEFNDDPFGAVEIVYRAKPILFACARRASVEERGGDRRALHIIAEDDLGIFAVHHHRVRVHKARDFGDGAAVGPFSTFGHDKRLRFAMTNNRFKSRALYALGLKIEHSGLGAAQTERAIVA